MIKFKFLFPFLLILSACTPIQDLSVEPVVEEPVVVTDPKSLINFALKPDESGQIMVLMYHNIGLEEETWVRTPEAFRQDLETLYTQGFRPISLNDYASGNISTEAGKTPVIITFDDGRLNNYKYLEDGSIDPNCAVAILIEFHTSHPDFPLEATFFLTGATPFGQSSSAKQKINELINLGMDVGNHTLNHPNFSKINDAQTIQSEIGGQAQYIESFIDTEYNVNTLALTYGSRPKGDELQAYLISGSYQDIPYTNTVLLNVGSNPALSPYHLDFNPYNVPRVRASETKTDGVGLYDYLAQYSQYPERRFVSDGNAEIVTIPSSRADKIQASIEKELYVY